MPHFRVTVLPSGRKEIREVVERAAIPPEFAGRAQEAGLELDNPVVGWLAVRCVLAEGSAVPASELYQDFKRFAENRGQDPGSLTRFGRVLSELRIPAAKTGLRGRVERHGLRLRRVRASDSEGS